jgi:hypothetical protein
MTLLVVCLALAALLVLLMPRPAGFGGRCRECRGPCVTVGYVSARCTRCGLYQGRV